MIIGESFLHDPKWVQNIQYKLYGYSINLIFVKAREKYFEAEKVLDLETALGNSARSIHSFDHRTLQYMHDSIAADFRYNNTDMFQQRIRGAFSNYSLYGEFDPPDDVYIEIMWREYYSEKIDEMFRSFSYLPKLVLLATTFPNPDLRGCEAEDSIFTIVENLNSNITEYRNTVYLNKPPKNIWSMLSPDFENNISTT